MVSRQAKHIQLPLETIEKIYNSLISPDLTDNEIQQLYAELINALPTDAVRDLIKLTQEKSEESIALQLKLIRLILDEYNQWENFLLSELKMYSTSMINLYPIDKIPISEEYSLLPLEIMQKFYIVRRLFTLVLDARKQENSEFWKRWLFFPQEEKLSDTIVKVPFFSALHKEAFMNKDRIDFLNSLKRIKANNVSDNSDFNNILDNALVTCKFLMEGLKTASILAQLKIKTMSYEYSEKNPNKSKLILFVNDKKIDFKGKTAKHLKPILENPFEDLFMADLDDEATDANKKEYDKSHDEFARVNNRIYLEEELRPFHIYPFIVINKFSVKLNPDYAPFFAVKSLKYKKQ